MYPQNQNLVLGPAQSLTDLVQNDRFASSLLTGYGLGKDLIEQTQQRQVRTALANAYDPQTGQFDWGRAIGALAPINPEAAIRMQQQKRLEEQQQAGLQAALAGDYSPEERQVLMGYGTSGDWGRGLAEVGKLRAARSQADYARSQELINVTDPKTGAVYQVPRGQALPSPSAQPSPAGQSTPSAQPIPSGQPAPSAQPIPSAPGSAKEKGTLFDQYQQAPWFSDMMGLANTFRIDPKFMLSLIHQESGGNPEAVSPKGAIGLGQLMPATAQRFGVQNPRDPIQNLTGAAKYIRFLLDRYGGDYQKVAAAYNAGEGAVDKYGGIPPFAETQRYVPAVLVGAGFGAGPTPARGGGAQVAQAPGGPVSDAGSPGLLAKRPPAVEQQEQERIRQRYQIEAEQRAEQARIAAEQRAAQEKMAAEQRAGPNKLTVGGEEAWVDSVYKPALLEQKTNTDRLAKLDLMERLNQKGLTGPGAPFWQGVKAFLNAAGVPSSIVDVTPEQELVAQSNNLIWDTLAQQKGPQTDNDFKRMQAIWPNLQNTPEANQFLIDSSRVILNRRQQQINFYRKNYQEYAKKGNPSALDEAWNATPEAQRSVWDEPTMRRWAGTAGGTQAGGTQAPGTPGAAAPTAAGGGKTFDQQAVIELSKKYNKPPAEIRRGLEAKGYIYAP